MGAKIYSEFLGTFVLVLIGVGSIVNNAGLLGVAVAHGLAIAVMVSALAGISSAHFNPAVSFGFLVTKRISLSEFIKYLLAQLAGATTAAIILKFVLGLNSENIGIPKVNGVSIGNAVLIEAVATFLLMTTIYGVAFDSRGTFKAVAGFPIGLMITLDILAIGPVTGGVMNPARWFGPALVGMNFSAAIVWIIGPLLGAGIAALAYERIAKL